MRSIDYIKLIIFLVFVSPKARPIRYPIGRIGLRVFRSIHLSNLSAQVRQV